MRILITSKQELLSVLTILENKDIRWEAGQYALDFVEQPLARLEHDGNIGIDVDWDTITYGSPDYADITAEDYINKNKEYIDVINNIIILNKKEVIL